MGRNYGVPHRIDLSAVSRREDLFVQHKARAIGGALFVAVVFVLGSLLLAYGAYAIAAHVTVQRIAQGG
jgi:hypothetical protein